MVVSVVPTGTPVQLLVGKAGYTGQVRVPDEAVLNWTAWLAEAVLSLTDAAGAVTVPDSGSTATVGVAACERRSSVLATTANTKTTADDIK